MKYKVQLMLINKLAFSDYRDILDGLAFYIFLKGKAIWGTLVV